jgi:hypothetical protein
MELNPAGIAWCDAHKLMIGSNVPPLAGFVSALSPDGWPNLAGFSLSNAVCGSPLQGLPCPTVGSTISKAKNGLTVGR